MKTLIAAALLLALASPAHAAKKKPYQPPGDAWACAEVTAEDACIRQGMRDYREGQCFRARPYDDGSPEQKFWERGYHAQAKKKPRDMSHCYGTRGKIDNQLMRDR